MPHIPPDGRQHGSVRLVLVCRVCRGLDDRGVEGREATIVAAVMPPVGGEPGVERIETTGKAVRRLVDRLGGPEGLAVCYEAGPGGFALYRLLSSMGVACDVVAPSLIPVRAMATER